MNFSEILIQRRKQLGLSQEALAEKIQVSRQAVSKWETGEAMPDMTKLIALADALEMTLDALCGRTFPAQAVNFAPAKPVPKRRTWVPWVLSAALLLCCVVLLLNAAKPSPPASLYLPDGISVSGVRFSQEDGGFLSYRFSPAWRERTKPIKSYFREKLSNRRPLARPMMTACALALPICPMIPTASPL